MGDQQHQPAPTPTPDVQGFEESWSEDPPFGALPPVPDSAYGPDAVPLPSAAAPPAKIASALDLQVAVEAATKSLHDLDCPEGDECREVMSTTGGYGRTATRAVTAATPHILLAAAKRAAALGNRWADAIGEQRHAQLQADRFGFACQWLLALADEAGGDHG